MVRLFHAIGAIISKVEEGTDGEYRYVIFDYDSNSGETAHTDTVAALKTEIPHSPETSLSRASGLHLERIGGWIVAYEPHRYVRNRKALLHDVENLLRYASDFPQNR